MKLITQEIKRQIPKLYEQENNPDPIVYVKFFTPTSNWTWYATEFDGIDQFFGLVIGFEQEFGYFSLQELESIDMGLGIKRDMYFTPKPLSEVKKLHTN